MPELPYARTARERFGLDSILGDGNATDRVQRSHLAVARRIAARVNAARPAGAPSVQAGELAALGLLHDIFHLVVERAAEVEPRAAMPTTTEAVEQTVGPRTFVPLLDAFAEEFPDVDEAPPPGRLEELVLVRVANENPAVTPLRELIDDRPLPDGPLEETVGALEAYDASLTPVGPDGETLLELLRAPARAHPTSLAGQLRYIRERWRGLLGGALDAMLDEVLLTLDVIAEEERGLHLRFGGGFGDGGGRADIPDLTGLENEPERFSSDSAWMPRLVLVAKSTHVWLDQLSRRYSREIRTLDAIPDEELDRLVRWGITGLWFIGLWQRSRASQRIKEWRGNPDAAASAYSLDEYRIADDLGGEEAWANLRGRAWARGLRLASDMVPNHMGIDSRWVIEHPEWFLSLPEPPYPGYRYESGNVADDERVEIRLEDHYWDNTDAAVTFERRDRVTGDHRYIYHGNDGTSFPWNDTAQLDFSSAEVREQVIQTILDVARRFPVIRFDAAMVLAKKHVRRLWFPAPGEGGGIPSRAEHGSMTQAEFDRRMPQEFWREVVDRVATEVPDTLLLAEAFWLLEGYFVRTLGMHRVYNSAFMHMLRDEDNAGYRRVMKDTLEFDREILKRYVNFMNNPDERTAVEQFGKGDKYFGIATLLATLPGLPLFGHGQLEGFAEKYGMEYRRAYRDETIDEGLLAYHERTIVPLLHRRAQFAEVRDFLLYDVTSDGGRRLDDVFAYSNVGPRGERSLVVYHNRFGSASGWVRESVPFSVPDEAGGGRTIVKRTLGDGWRLADADGAFVLWRDHASGLEHLAPARELRGRGVRVELGAYERMVLLDVRDVRDGSTRLWSRLNDRLAGGGVPSLDDALRDLALEPVHEPIRTALGGTIGRLVRDGQATDDGIADEVRRIVHAVGELTSTGGPNESRVTDASVSALREIGRRAGQRSAAPGRRDAAGEADAGANGDDDPLAPVVSAFADRRHRAVLATWALVAPLGALAPGDPVATSRAWYDELHLDQPVAAGLRSAGLDEGEAWSVAALVRLLIDLPRPSTVGGR